MSTPSLLDMKSPASSSSSASASSSASSRAKKRSASYSVQGSSSRVSPIQKKKGTFGAGGAGSAASTGSSFHGDDGGVVPVRVYASDLGVPEGTFWTCHLVMDTTAEDLLTKIGIRLNLESSELALFSRSPPPELHVLEIQENNFLLPLYKLWEFQQVDYRFIVRFRPKPTTAASSSEKSSKQSSTRSSALKTPSSSSSPSASPSSSPPSSHRSKRGKKHPKSSSSSNSSTGSSSSSSSTSSNKSKRSKKHNRSGSTPTALQQPLPTDRQPVPSLPPTYRGPLTPGESTGHRHSAGSPLNGGSNDEQDPPPPLPPTPHSTRESRSPLDESGSVEGEQATNKDQAEEAIYGEEEDDEEPEVTVTSKEATAEGDLRNVSGSSSSAALGGLGSIPRADSFAPVASTETDMDSDEDPEDREETTPASAGNRTQAAAPEKSSSSAASSSFAQAMPSDADVTRSPSASSYYCPILKKQVSMAKEATPRREAKERLRHQAINEVVQTERDYIADLEILQKVFLGPLREEKILSDQEIIDVFSNIEAITRTNKALLVELETRIAECKKEVYGNISEQDQIVGERLLIGPTFSQLAAYLKMYAIYTNNQQSSMDLVKSLQSSNPRFARFLQEQLENPICAGLPLIGFLIKPVQRLCKYPLLLRELIRNTPNKHEDKPELTTAYKEIDATVHAINESKRNSENTRSIMDIIHLIEEGDQLRLLTPTRRFHRTLELEYVSSKKTRPLTLFLFNDLLVGATPPRRKRNKPGPLQLHSWIPLGRCLARKLPPTTDFAHAIQISHVGHSQFVVVASSEEQSVRLLDDLLDGYRRAQAASGERRGSWHGESPRLDQSLLDKLSKRHKATEPSFSSRVQML